MHNVVYATMAILLNTAAKILHIADKSELAALRNAATHFTISISDALDAVTKSDQYDAFAADVKCEFWSCAAVSKLLHQQSWFSLGFGFSGFIQAIFYR